MRRTWIKLYVDQCLRGSMMSELVAAQCWQWIGLLLLGGDSAVPGVIFRRKDESGGLMGYSDITLAETLNVDLEIYRDGIRRMVDKDKIAVDEKGVITILNWGKYQSEYQRQKPYRGESDKKKSNKGDALEGDVEEDRDRDVDVEKKALLYYIEKVSRVFSRANYNLDDQTIIYIGGLCAEFPELDHEAELKAKMAWWVNHPLTPKSNVCLQVRNWFVIARKKLEARRAHDLVGTAGRRPDPGAEADRVDYQAFQAEFVKIRGLASAEDIDPFKFPDFSEYRQLKRQKPEVLRALLQPAARKGTTEEP